MLSPHPSRELQLPVKCDTSAFFDCPSPTPGSIDEKQTASELLCPLCLSTLPTSPRCVTETAPVPPFHTLRRLRFGTALSHCSLSLPPCSPNRQSTSPQNLSLAALCHSCPASNCQAHVQLLPRVRILPFAASFFSAYSGRSGRLSSLSFLASVLYTIITYAQPTTSTTTVSLTFEETYYLYSILVSQLTVGTAVRPSSPIYLD